MLHDDITQGKIAQPLKGLITQNKEHNRDKEDKKRNLRGFHERSRNRETEDHNASKDQQRDTSTDQTCFLPDCERNTICVHRLYKTCLGYRVTRTRGHLDPPSRYLRK